MKISECFSLQANQCRTIKADAVRVTAGTLWLTQCGRDYFLLPGDEFHPAKSGKTVVQALDDNTAVYLLNRTFVSFGRLRALFAGRTQRGRKSACQAVFH